MPLRSRCRRGMAREKKRLPSPQGKGARDRAAVPKNTPENMSIFSLKRCAFQTIRPVVSRKKRGFSAHFGPGGAVPPPRVSPGKKGSFAKGGSSTLKNRKNATHEQNSAFCVSHCFLKGGCCHRWTNRIEERKLRRSPCREYVACFFTGDIPNRNALLRSGRERRGPRARHARKLIMAFAS